MTSQYTVNTFVVNGVPFVVDTTRLPPGGIYNSDPAGFFQALANDASGLIPFTPISVANAGTVNLSSSVPVNVLDTTSHGTIAGAVINLPTNPVDGQHVSFSTTGAITTVTGTVESGTVYPVVSTLAAGQTVRLRYNATATAWYHV